MKLANLFLSLTTIFMHTLTAAEPWSPATYPDEPGFTQRMAPMLQRIAAQDFGKRSLATSKCPDTGLPVRVWAVEGETIFSPYTGRAYTQGPTGYFGPKARNDNGDIIAFGGDPLKYDLPPATAALLLNPDDDRAKAFLSIPGNLRQQYHFACKNWARFFPLLKEQMGPDWQNDFYYYVGRYSESRRPSDGDRQWLPLSEPHNLIGEPGELLGGNPKDGGTENHKTMWRTSGLLYSQLFPDTAWVSGVPVDEAEEINEGMISDYLQRILQTGNGEYDSQVYYPHTIEAFLNLYDFTPDADTRELAQFALDYYFATYGLKVIDGAIAGPQKRGYLTGGTPNEMEIMQWGFFNHTSRDMRDVATTIQQATTTYRPNQIIWDIVRKNIPLPFEAKMSRPFYHMDHPHAFAERFYCSESYGMGNMQMTIVDNPNQQMVWSLVARGTDGPLCFSGGHPMRGSTSGHSPYTQTLQSNGTLILLSAPTRILNDVDTLIAPTYSKSDRPNLWHLPEGEQGPAFELRNRQKYGKDELHPLEFPQAESAQAYNQFWQQVKGSACSWLYFPAKLEPVRVNELWCFAANQTYVAVRPLTSESRIVAPPTDLIENMDRQPKRFFQDYSLLVFPGDTSGFVLETEEASEFASLQDFAAAVQQKSKLDTAALTSHMQLSYTSLKGDVMDMQYRAEGLRCAARINGEVQDWDNFTDGAVYTSPYITVKNGRMEINNGESRYAVEFVDGVPEWQERIP